MLSSTFELIFMASSNSHIIFCLCNFIIAILLLSGFQSSSQDNTTNILDHDMSKRKGQGNSKAKQFHKGMNDIDYHVGKMDTCVTSQQMQTFSISSDISTIEAIRDINQDNKKVMYDNAVCVQYYESVYSKQSHHQETSFKFENVETVSINDTVGRKTDTRAILEEIEVLGEVNQNKKSEAYHDVDRFQHYESGNYKQSLNEDMSYKCENAEEANANITIDTKMNLAKAREETNNYNFEKSDEKEDNELRKRIEDFIEKVNKGWRAEKLGIYYQSQLTV